MKQTFNAERMRSVILAAGQGTRLQPLTDHHPKCLTPLFGQPMIKRQIGVLRQAGIDNICVVGGYLFSKLDLPHVQCIENKAYKTTNMVESMFVVPDLFDGVLDLLISYGDIVYEPRILDSILSGTHDINVVVDKGWLDLWSIRMENPLDDAESLKLGNDGRILEIGKVPNSIDEIEGQYIGLIAVRASAATRIKEYCSKKQREDSNYLKNMYMTELLQSLIEVGFDVGAVQIEHGWLEVDSISDLRAYEDSARTGQMEHLFNV